MREWEQSSVTSMAPVTLVEMPFSVVSLYVVTSLPRFDVVVVDVEHQLICFVVALGSNRDTRLRSTMSTTMVITAITPPESTLMELPRSLSGTRFRELRTFSLAKSVLLLLSLV